MEPANPKVKIPAVYAFYAQVETIQERFKHLYKSGFGETTQYEKASLGWFMSLKGSHEALRISTDKPPINAGDLVKVTIKVIPNADS